MIMDQARIRRPIGESWNDQPPANSRLVHAVVGNIVDANVLARIIDLRTLRQQRDILRLLQRRRPESFKIILPGQRGQVLV
ncbi:hypothetical protein D3C84_889130 [compost metagenome]